MRLAYFGLTILIGIVLTIHLAMNGRVGLALDNPRVGNALFWCIGAVTALLIGLSGWTPGALKPLGTISPAFLIAGALGACLVFGIAFLMPRVGAARFTLIMLAGQILAGLVLSHYGWLGSPKEPLTVKEMAGAVVMFVGVYLVVG